MRASGKIVPTVPVLMTSSIPSKVASCIDSVCRRCGSVEDLLANERLLGTCDTWLAILQLPSGE
jgi:hypothetical protein